MIFEQRRLHDEQLNDEFCAVMRDLLQIWLASPFEGGPTAESIIQSDRLRVPLYSTGGDHMIDCDCPICEMMATEMFGPSYRGYDGHALECDDDFAFSMLDTIEEWEQQQKEYAEMSAKIEVDIARRKELEGFMDEDSTSLRISKRQKPRITPIIRPVGYLLPLAKEIVQRFKSCTISQAKAENVD